MYTRDPVVGAARVHARTRALYKSASACSAFSPARRKRRARRRGRQPRRASERASECVRSAASRQAGQQPRRACAQRSPAAAAAAAATRLLSCVTNGRVGAGVVDVGAGGGSVGLGRRDEDAGTSADSRRRRAQERRASKGGQTAGRLRQSCRHHRLRLGLREGNRPPPGPLGLPGLRHGVGRRGRRRLRAAARLLAATLAAAAGHHAAAAGAGSARPGSGAAGTPRFVGSGEQRRRVRQLWRHRALSDVHLPRLHGGQLFRNAQRHPNFPAAAKTRQRASDHRLQSGGRPTLPMLGCVRSVQSGAQPFHGDAATRAGAVGSPRLHHSAFVLQDGSVHRHHVLGGPTPGAAARAFSSASGGLWRGLRGRDQGALPPLCPPRQPGPQPCSGRHGAGAAGAAATGPLLRRARSGPHVLGQRLLSFRPQEPIPPASFRQEEVGAAGAPKGRRPREGLGRPASP